MVTQERTAAWQEASLGKPPQLPEKQLLQGAILADREAKALVLLQLFDLLHLTHAVTAL
jgi:hypothetical protein